jgi:hypothetical protein
VFHVDLGFKQKRQNQTLKIHEKTKQKTRHFRELLALEPDDVEFVENLKKKQMEEISIPKGVTGKSHMYQKSRFIAEERHFGRENLQDLVAKKREMFFLQYALGVKRDEITKLEEIAQVEIIHLIVFSLV